MSIFRALGAAVLLLVFGASGSFAEDPEDLPPDPIDKSYAMGSDHADPDAVARSPKFFNYRSFLPPAVDLTSRLPKPGDQGEVGSCAAWAVGYAARAYYTNYFEGRPLSRSENIPSPGYLYHIARQRAAAGDRCHQGSAITDNVRVLKSGALSLRDYPYDRDDKCQRPAPETFVARATDFKVRGFVSLSKDSIEDIRGKLAEDNPVVFVFKTSQAFHRHRGARVFRDESWPNGGADDNLHAMTLVGYDDTRQAFRLINSWGRGWGDRGYAWLGYDVFKSHTEEAYVLDVDGQRPSPAPVPQPPPAPAPQPSPQPPPVPKPDPAKLDLSSYKCAKLHQVTGRSGNVIDGYVWHKSDLDDLKGKLQAFPSTKLGDVLVAPWPQCEALQTLDKGLESGSLKPVIDTGGKVEFVDGDKLSIKIKAPSQISYLYVTYIQADGNAVHLVQPRGATPNPTLPNQIQVFGDGEEGRQKFVVGEPFGRELVIAVASKSPLFEGPLPERQTDREYLSALRKAIIYKAETSMPDREISAAILSVVTRGNK